MYNGEWSMPTNKNKEIYVSTYYVVDYTKV